MAIKEFQKISSPENERIKGLKKLKDKKFRREAGLFMVENLAIIADALKDGHDFESLYATEEFADKHRDELRNLMELSSSPGHYLLVSKLNKLYSSLDTPSGIAAVYPIEKKMPDQTSVVYLNGIADPGNLGTIMRSALAFGYSNLVLDKNCVDAYNPKVVGAAKDAIFKLNVLEEKDSEWFKGNMLPVYAASAKEGTELSGFKPAQAYCLVLGNESHGVSPEIMKRAEKCLKIKISPRIESLNVASAAAILFYVLQGRKEI